MRLFAVWPILLLCSLVSIITSCAGSSKHPGNECNAERLCSNDQHCVNGYCVAWKEGEFDSTCANVPVIAPTRPALQCIWSQPPAGDSAPDHKHILHTPLVANLGIEASPGVAPRANIVFIADTAAFPYQTGFLRVIDGASCRELGSATTASADPLIDEQLVSSVTPAAGDLNGDGRTDVVAVAASGGLIAFTWDPQNKKLVKLWKSVTTTGANDTYGVGNGNWGGISLADLNDDGLAEIVFDGVVWTHDGVLFSIITGWASSGADQTAAVLANVDADPAIELVSGETVWQWDTATNQFKPERPVKNTRGWIAIGDFGVFPNALGANAPEIVKIVNGTITLSNLAGDAVRTFATGDVLGGAPTIADYDGDGAPEIGAAFAGAYWVYDPADNKALWHASSKDATSGRTGSSVFDFNGDGRAEAVYADECYVRVYDGITGAVQFSQARFSSTWNENPIIADVDGDLSAEIVVGSSGSCAQTYCGDHDNNTIFDDVYDPIYRGVTCDKASDCRSGQCVVGLCRCTDDSMCEGDYGCTVPIVGTLGEGNVCRARHTTCSSGLRVFRDAHNQWSSGRAMWNQHAYAVTNINDDGTLPRSSQIKNNWQTMGLNNFRQNVPVIGGARPVADLTARGATLTCSTASLQVTICNRGSALADTGIPVAFTTTSSTQEICRALTQEPLAPGQCTKAECKAPADTKYSDISVVIDPDDNLTECQSGNNTSTQFDECVTAL